MKPAPPVTNIRFPCNGIVATLASGHAGPTRRLARRACRRRRGFVERAWRLVVRRAPEEPGRSLALEKLRDGTLSRAGLLRQLVGSEEFDRVAALDDGLAFAAAERSLPARSRGRRARATCTRRREATSARSRSPGASPATTASAACSTSVTAFAEPAYLAALRALGAEELVRSTSRRPRCRGSAALRPTCGHCPSRTVRFDLAFCISTLEHVGRDNDVYAVEAPRDDSGDEAALHELRRVCVHACSSACRPGCTKTTAGSCSARRSSGSTLFERSGFIVFEDELYVPRRRRLAECDARRGRGRTVRDGPGAGAVLLAELRPSTFSEKLRLAVRDVRHRGDARRATVP